MKDFVVQTSGVELAGISCLFGQTPAIRHIDLSVPQGEFLALVGPSGAGKTTLLRVIAGLEPGYTGRLSIGTRDVTRVPARERNIGFVFQSYALFGHMSVRENVAFGLRVRPWRRRPDRRTIGLRVRELLELVQVAHLADRKPAQLSGGQRQRVALARALAIEPELLLLDEPFGALDPLVRKDIRSWLRGLHDRLGLTSILVTHDQGEAIEVADRIALLRDGALEQVGTPEQLDRHPVNAFVHQFLGESVRFEATITNGRAVPRGLEASSLPVALPDGPGVVSIRPYEIGLQGGDGPGTVLFARRIGAFTRYEVDVAGRVIEALAPAVDVPLSPGARCCIDLSRAHVFSALT
nr:ABC transporter ATP-binding protein [uncultured Lichenicoccus sp.]